MQLVPRSVVRWLIVVSLALGGGAALHVVADPAQPSSQPVGSAAEFAWITGRWTLERNGDTLEEVWSEPSGNCVMGMFRWMKKDRTVRLFELMTIVVEGDDTFFRFRHFGPDMKAWEEKDQPLSFKLTSRSEGEAVFENPDAPRFKRYALKKTDGGMLVTVNGDRFDYRRDQ